MATIVTSSTNKGRYAAGRLIGNIASDQAPGFDVKTLEFRAINNLEFGGDINFTGQESNTIYVTGKQFICYSGQCKIASSAPGIFYIRLPSQLRCRGHSHVRCIRRNWQAQDLLRAIPYISLSMALRTIIIPFMIPQRFD